MLIAKQKRKENIAEYILYMFQVEDLIRAFRFDIDLIKTQLVPQYKVDNKTSDEITEWYRNLVLMMEKEGVKAEGHLQFLVNLINDLNEFHLFLINSDSGHQYLMDFQPVTGIITKLRLKNNSEENDIRFVFSTIYSYLIRKIRKKEISTETTENIKRLSQWLGTLSQYYKKSEKGELEL